MLTNKERIALIKDKYEGMNLVEMVHAFLVEESIQNQKERREQGRIGKFYPSSVGKCKRFIAYQMLGYPGKPSSGKNMLVLENGTYFHERMEDLFERMNIMIAPELVLKHEDLRISARSDAIIWNFLRGEDEPDGEVIQLHRQVEVDGEKQVDEEGNPVLECIYEGPQNDVLIVEFKSAKDKSYHDYTPKTKPQGKHEMQLQLYFYMTGIRKGLVYYENKNDQNQKYFIVEYNQKIIDELIADIQFVIEYVDKKELPDREYQPVDFECRWCDYRDICYPETNPIDYSKLL